MVKEKLLLLKEKYDLTNERWSELSGVPVGTISGIMSGRTARPAWDDIVAMVTCLGESLDVFCGHAALQPVAASDETPVIVQQHHFSFMPFRNDVRDMALEAIKEVYASASHKSTRLDAWIWKGLALGETALIVGVLIFDITHPTMGYIQYEVASAANAAIDLIRRMV